VDGDGLDDIAFAGPHGVYVANGSGRGGMSAPATGSAARTRLLIAATLGEIAADEAGNPRGR
jgi:hypothetical protein